LSISLTGGGDLVINDSGSIGATASLASVPEPSTVIGTAQAVLLLGLVSRLRRRKA
jgi:hypothetical protein